MRIVQLFLILCLALSLHGQSAVDALRYSRLIMGGTARSIGAGNAFGAVGADFSVIGTNPAGIGLLRATEISITPGISSMVTTANFEGEAFKGNRTRFVVPNVGIAIHAPLGGENWKAINFGFGMSRMADFNQRFTYEGTSTGSIAEMWLNNAQGVSVENLNPFSEQLAYQGYLIDNSFAPAPFTEYTSVLNASSRTFKQESFAAKGGINDLQFALATNYKDKLYLGLSISASFLNYTSERTYAETDPNNTEPDFVGLDFQEDLKTKGTGVNLKLGLLYRAAKWVRFGLGFHTPTWYRLNDQFSSALSAQAFYNGQLQDDTYTSPQGEFRYTLRTPVRAIGSVALVAKKIGFFSAEVEWVNYGATEFDFIEDLNAADQSFLRDLNQQIANNYANAINARFGGELVFDIFRLRAGYGYYGTPFQASAANSEKEIQHTFSFGAGIREDHFFLDLAYRYLYSKSGYLPYVTETPNPPIINNQLGGNLFVLTLGFRFGGR